MTGGVRTAITTDRLTGERGGSLALSREDEVRAWAGLAIGSLAVAGAFAVLVALSLAGASIRTFFVARHKGKASLLPVIIGVLLLAAVAICIAPPVPGRRPAQEGVAAFTHVQAIIKERCTGCHASAPTQPGFNAAPKGVMFDTPEQILAQAVQIHQQTLTRVMPLANLTHMTDDERATIAAWFQQGAHK